MSRHSSQAAFLSTAVAGSLTCAIRIQPPKGQKKGRALRGKLPCVYICGRLVLRVTPAPLIGLMLHKQDSPSALEEKHSEDAQSLSVWSAVQSDL